MCLLPNWNFIAIYHKSEYFTDYGQLAGLRSTTTWSTVVPSSSLNMGGTYTRGDSELREKRSFRMTLSEVAPPVLSKGFTPITGPQPW